MKRFLLSIGFLGLMGLICVLTVNADSTITIPVPEKAAIDRKVTLSLKIPPNTDPLITKKGRNKLTSRSSLVMWDNNPSPKIPITDEIYPILDRFNEKGWVKGLSAQPILKQRPIPKLFGVRLLEKLIDLILDFAQSPNMVRSIRKSNLTATDIEDLRRMTNRFAKELSMSGKNVKRVDKDLLMLQEQIKKAKAGILQVIKVEGTDDGGTVIHLNVE